MIWQNAWAWLGLLTLALPIVIHLLSRRSARVQNFPSLRFLTAAQLLPKRRAQLTEPLLLAVRCAILLTAVAALAQPLLLTDRRARELGRTLARAIVIDTSASMRRNTPDGVSAIAAARRVALQAQDAAATGLQIESAAPAQALAGAAAWLNTQPGRREVVIISDFQDGTVSASNIGRIPAEIGVQLQRIALAAGSAPLEFSTRANTARVTLAGERTDVEWTARLASADTATVQLVTGASERSRAEAARQAALSVATAPAAAAQHPVTIVYPGATARAQLLRAARPLTEPWMGEVVARLRGDSALAAAAGTAEAIADSAANAIVLARNAQGAPVAIAASGSIDGKPGLVLFALVDAGSLASAALIAATANAQSSAAAASELEPAFVPAELLQRWQRPAAPNVTVREQTGASDGRWLWLLVLALLGVETWLRRARRPAVNAAAQELHREHAA